MRTVSESLSENVGWLKWEGYFLLPEIYQFQQNFSFKKDFLVKSE